jgi:hypothetical protein
MRLLLLSIFSAQTTKEQQEQQDERERSAMYNDMPHGNKTRDERRSNSEGTDVD